MFGKQASILDGRQDCMQSCSQCSKNACPILSIHKFSTDASNVDYFVALVHTLMLHVHSP